MTEIRMMCSAHRSTLRVVVGIVNVMLPSSIGLTYRLVFRPLLLSCSLSVTKIRSNTTVRVASPLSRNLFTCGHVVFSNKRTCQYTDYFVVG